MNRILTIVLVSFFSSWAYGQDDLLNMLDDDNKSDAHVLATFKATRVVLGHSVKTKKKGELEFLISHRFGTINSGAHNLWGLDESSIRLGLEYGISNDFNIGIGRSSFDKTFDGFVKYKLIKQTESGSLPVSMVLFSSLAIETEPRKEDNPTIEFSDRLASTVQLLIARKFNSNLSLQVTPTYIHKNRLTIAEEISDLLALGMSGRYKITPSVSANVEYFYRINPHSNSPYHDAVSVGFDIETGGHVFQLHLTNSVMSVEKAFVTEVFDDFFDGDIHFGFNISRTFQLDKSK